MHSHMRSHISLLFVNERRIYTLSSFYEYFFSLSVWLSLATPLSHINMVFLYFHIVDVIKNSNNFHSSTYITV